MSYKMMWQMTWRKVRYGLKSYLFFLIVSIIFIVVYFLFLCFADAESIYEDQNIIMLTFLYVSVLCGQSFQGVEYSKCHYLVPKTQADRKKFVRFQNYVKMTVSMLLLTLLLGIGVAIRPEAAQYLFNWYMICGVCFTVVIGCNGYSTYLLKKKKTSYSRYIVTNIITVVVISSVILGGMFLIHQVSVTFWIIGSFGILFLALLYHLYYHFRFKKVKAIYENIDKAEQRYVKRLGNTVM